MPALVSFSNDQQVNFFIILTNKTRTNPTKDMNIPEATQTTLKDAFISHILLLHHL